MKPLLLTLTLLFCIKPIQTNAVENAFSNAEVKQMILHAAEIGFEEGKAFKDDIGLKRLTIDDLEGML